MEVSGTSPLRCTKGAEFEGADLSIRLYGLA